MYLGMNYSPTVPGGGAASYKLQPVFTYNNGYWEVVQTFSGGFFLGFGGRVEGGGYVGGSLIGEIFHGGKNSMKRAQDESGHVRKKRQIQSLIYNAGSSEPLYYGV